jgi:hypothetical protein
VRRHRKPNSNFHGEDRSSVGTSPDRVNQIAQLLSELADLMRQGQFGKDVMHHLHQLQMRIRFAKEKSSAVRQSETPERPPALLIDRKNKSETPIEFIVRGYRRWLGRGLTRAHLRKLDMGLYDALKHWLRENKPPADFDLPTKSEMIDRRLALADSLSVRHSPEQKAKLRLREAAADDMAVDLVNNVVLALT